MDNIDNGISIITDDAISLLNQFITLKKQERC